MTKFSPPAIKKNNSKYKVEDILVLHELNKRPTFVNAPLETFSGHTHSIDSFKARDIFLDFVKVVSNLREKELIRENLPKEILKHLTVAEMKVILKATSKTVSGTRDILINRIEKHVSDEDISNNTDKSCFVLTEIGLEVLKKYKNVLWIHKNKRDIFRYPLFYESKFDEYYFMNHWDLNLPNTIIEYYETKNSGIVARIYQIENNPEKSFLYGLRKLTEEINLQLEKCKEVGWFNTSAGLGEFLSLNSSPELGEPLSFKTIFKSLNISDDNLDEVLKYIYDYAIKDPSLVTFNNYKKIIIALLTNHNDELYKKLLDDLYLSIKNDDQKYSNDEKKSLKDILDRITIDEKRKEEMVLELIDVLDLEAIKKIKMKIDKKIKKKNYIRSFSEIEIEKYLKYTDKNVIPLDEVAGNCFICGVTLSDVELPKGPEKKIVCLEDRDLFVESYIELQKLREI